VASGIPIEENILFFLDFTGKVIARTCSSRWLPLMCDSNAQIARLIEVEITAAAKSFAPTQFFFLVLIYLC
jgi:hypothetical protein